MSQIESIMLIVLYATTGEEAYVREATINTLINVAAISAGLAIGQAAKTIGNLIGSHVDDVVDGVRPGIRPVGPGGGGAGGPGSALLPDDILEEIIEKYGDDVADAISKHGKKGTQLYEEFGDDFAQAVKNLGDADDVIRLTDDYTTRADEVLHVINRYGDDAIRLVDEYGDEFLDHASSIDDLDEIKGLLGSSYESSSINLPIINEKVNGLIPVDEYLEIRTRSLKNAESNTMTLGKYLRNTETGEVLPEAYTEMAKKYGDTYFDLGTEWDVIKGKYGVSDADMFELFNFPALDYAVESGKTIRFSQDPTLPIYIDSALADEWNYLKREYGYIDLIKEGEFWYAIK